MTRHRKCCFKDTVLATLSCSMNRSNTELLYYFGLQNPNIPSKSAFTQQRKKLSASLFPHLLEAFNNAVPFKKKYKDYHLVAVDGSDINLPTDRNDSVYCMKQARSDGRYYQMHINALYDICEERYISAMVQPRPDMNENAAFCQLLRDCTMPSDTIFIADRGYAAVNTLALLIEQKKHFLIRVKTPSEPSSLASSLLKPDTESDRVCKVCISRSKKVFRMDGFDKCICLQKTGKFDSIRPEDKTSVYSMSLRFTCIKLIDGSFEYLVSDLPADIFPPSELRALYWKRWSIETSFRSLKYALSLVYLHSVRRELIIQEIYAKMIMYNFTSMVHAYAEECRKAKERSGKEKYPHRVSFDDAVPICRLFLKQCISNEKLKALLLKHLTAIKVNAASARHMRSQTVKPLNNRA